MTFPFFPSVSEIKESTQSLLIHSIVTCKREREQKIRTFPMAFPPPWLQYGDENTDKKKWRKEEREKKKQHIYTLTCTIHLTTTVSKVSLSHYYPLSLPLPSLLPLSHYLLIHVVVFPSLFMPSFLSLLGFTRDLSFIAPLTHLPSNNPSIPSYIFPWLLLSMPPFP